MLLPLLFGAGLVVALPVAVLIHSRRTRLAVAGVGVLGFVAYAVYVEKVAACPTQGECDKGLGILFLAFVLAGWLVGIAFSWLVRRPTRR